MSTKLRRHGRHLLPRAVTAVARLQASCSLFLSNSLFIQLQSPPDRRSPSQPHSNSGLQLDDRRQLALCVRCVQLAQSSDAVAGLDASPAPLDRRGGSSLSLALLSTALSLLKQSPAKTIPSPSELDGSCCVMAALRMLHTSDLFNESLSSSPSPLGLDLGGSLALAVVFGSPTCSLKSAQSSSPHALHRQSCSLVASLFTLAVRLTASHVSSEP